MMRRLKKGEPFRPAWGGFTDPAPVDPKQWAVP